MSAQPVQETPLDDLFDIGLQQAKQGATTADTRVKPKAHVGYQKDPVGWARDVLGIPEHTLRWSLNPGYYDANGVATHVWDGTPDPIAAMMEAVANWESAGVESGTGTGKSFGLAVLILWFLACFEDSRVFTFAAQEEQLKLYVWAEIGKLWGRFHAYFPSAELTDLRIRMDAGDAAEDSWGARGRAAALRQGEQVSARAAGMHAKYLLILNEETQGMEPAILEAQENTLTGPFNVRVSVGNPNNIHDALHQACLSPGTRHIRASSLDHPNIVTDNPHLIEGAVSRSSIERRAKKYGVGSPLYESRVRGVSASESAEALIRTEWVEAAFQRYRERIANGPITGGRRAKGVDVAQSENGDKASIADGVDNVCTGVRSFPCPNAKRLAEQVYGEAKRDGVDPAHIGIDPIGVGASTLNELRDLFTEDGVLVQALNGGAATKQRGARAPDGTPYDWVPDDNVFHNLRAQMYWQAREDLQHGRVDVAPDEELLQQLTLPTYKSPRGKTLIESKDDIRKRTGGKSPDKADAFVYWNWVRPRAVEPEPVETTLFEKVTGRKPPTETKAIHDRDHAQLREVPAADPAADEDVLHGARDPFWGPGGVPGAHSTFGHLDL